MVASVQPFLPVLFHPFDFPSSFFYLLLFLFFISLVPKPWSLNSSAGRTPSLQALIPATGGVCHGPKQLLKNNNNTEAANSTWSGIREIGAFFRMMLICFVDYHMKIYIYGAFPSLLWEATSTLSWPVSLLISSIELRMEEAGEHSNEWQPNLFCC